MMSCREPQNQHPHCGPTGTRLPHWGGSFVQGPGEVWAAFRADATGGGRRQLLTVALSINLGTAVLNTFLVSFD